MLVVAIPFSPIMAVCLLLAWLEYPSEHDTQW
jgi:hypothetical protein